MRELSRCPFEVEERFRDGEPLGTPIRLDVVEARDGRGDAQFRSRRDASVPAIDDDSARLARIGQHLSPSLGTRPTSGTLGVIGATLDKARSSPSSARVNENAH